MFVIVVVVILVLFVILSGLYQLLNAVWELRKGANRRFFLIRGMLGFALLAVAFLLPYIFMLTALNPANHVYPHIPGSGSWSSGSTSATGLPGHP